MSACDWFLVLENFLLFSGSECELVYGSDTLFLRKVERLGTVTKRPYSKSKFNFEEILIFYFSNFFVVYVLLF